MKTLQRSKLLITCAGLWLLLFFFVVPVIQGSETAQEATVASSKTESQSKPQQNLVDLLSYFTEISKHYVELENQMDELPVLSRFQTDMAGISNQIQLLSEKISDLSNDTGSTYDQMEIIKTRAYKLGYQVKKGYNPLFKTIENLSRLNREWAQKRDVLDEWAKISEDDVSFQLVKADILIHREQVNLALDHISKKLKPALAAQRQSLDLEVKIHSLTNDIKNIIQHFQQKEKAKTVSIFSVDFFSNIDGHLWKTIWTNFKMAADTQKKVLMGQLNSLLVLVLGIYLVAVLIRHSKKGIEASADWYLFTQRPFATSVFLCLAGLTLIEFFLEGAPQFFQGWEFTKRIVLLLSIFRLTHELLSFPWQRHFLFLIIVSVGLTEFFRTISCPKSIFYLFTLLTATLIMIFCMWQKRFLPKQQISFLGLLSLRLGTIVLPAFLLMEITGFQDTTLSLFIPLMVILIYIAMAGILALATKSIIELFLLKSPLSVTQRNSTVIVRQLTPLIILFYTFVLSILVLQFIDIYPTTEAAMESLASFNVAAGSWVISPGTILDAMVTIYGVILFSKAIQGLLLQVVLPRYNAAKGVRFSIVRLVRYAIGGIGFFLVLNVMGFELTSLTIFGGALGIGVGIGLQAIVTNIASGLILLFERPIKVGDMIQVNNEFGEVKNLGLRATVVQTVDNAEIVIPNSDLVTGQVTNWTLAERRSRVKIPVGVAYGTDTTNVLKILMTCADESPMVLSDPPPIALFLSFGESSLDFELRVWIPEFNDRTLVLSELNQEINNEFALAEIEIPFPQRDLHFVQTG